MFDKREDQAAGLRRLFRRAPPQVVALYACGRHRSHNAVLAAHRIAGHAERVLILDEAEGEVGLATALQQHPVPTCFSCSTAAPHSRTCCNPRPA